MFADLTILQAKVLALVAWADGKFDQTERIVFRDVLEASPGDDALKDNMFRMVEVPPEKRDVLEAVAASPREVAAAAIKNAFVLINADDHLHDAEMALLLELGQAAGVSPERSGDFRRMLETHLASLDLERELFGT